jgi:Dimethlysulfonioproprionate lyase
VDLHTRTRLLLDSLAAPALAPLLVDWPEPEERRAITPSPLPVLRWLPDAVSDAPQFSTALVTAVARAAPSMTWCQTYRSEDLHPAFAENYGWSELIGLRGPLASKRIACGFLLLGPDTLYPSHCHAAEEIYVPLAGTAAWQQGDGHWRNQPPGTLILHACEETHAMRTGARPLLALYLWRGAKLAEKSRFVRPPAG